MSTNRSDQLDRDLAKRKWFGVQCDESVDRGGTAQRLEFTQTVFEEFSTRQELLTPLPLITATRALTFITATGSCYDRPTCRVHHSLSRWPRIPYISALPLSHSPAGGVWKVMSFSHVMLWQSRTTSTLKQNSTGAIQGWRRCEYADLLLLTDMCVAAGYRCVSDGSAEDEFSFIFFFAFGWNQRVHAVPKMKMSRSGHRVDSWSCIFDDQDERFLCGFTKK